MGKVAAIVQSNYIPWKGYFDLVNLADEFIILDDVQYTRRDWRNRNQIKTAMGRKWLTIPVEAKGKYLQKICETTISDLKWNERHWRSIVHSYSRAPYFRMYQGMLEELYLGANQRFLSEVNFRFLCKICALLGITTRLSWSQDYDHADGKTERLVSLCKAVGATHYISGPAAKAYINERLFQEAGIALQYMDYGGYPEYEQLYPPFVHGVSIVDLLMSTGPNAPHFMKSFQNSRNARL